MLSQVNFMAREETSNPILDGQGPLQPSQAAPAPLSSLAWDIPWIQEQPQLLWQFQPSQEFPIPNLPSIPALIQFKAIVIFHQGTQGSAWQSCLQLALSAGISWAVLPFPTGQLPLTFPHGAKVPQIPFCSNLLISPNF